MFQVHLSVRNHHPYNHPHHHWGHQIRHHSRYGIPAQHHVCVRWQVRWQVVPRSMDTEHCDPCVLLLLLLWYDMDCFYAAAHMHRREGKSAPCTNSRPLLLSACNTTTALFTNAIQALQSTPPPEQRQPSHKGFAATVPTT